MKSSLFTTPHSSISFFMALKYIDILITLEKYNSVLCCLLRQGDAVKIVHIVLNHLDMIQD